MSKECDYTIVTKDEEVSKNENGEESNKSVPFDVSELEVDEYVKNMKLTDETSCGFWFLKGSFLQAFANKKVVVFLIGVTGCLYSSTSSYFNGTITTMEKRFRIASKTTGIISIGNDITQLLGSIILNYYVSKKHRPRWLAFGLYCVAMFCFLNALPHIIYGPGEDALQLTFEYGKDYIQNSTDLNIFENKNLCSKDRKETCDLEEGSIIPPIIWFISQLISGFGGTLYFSLGYSYLDDNIKKSKSPFFISFTYFMRMLGPALGYGIVSICLKLYIAPTLTPTIENLDPRWLGAWWLGWLILGVIVVIFSTLMALLPKTLPRTVARREILKLKSKYKDEEIQIPSVKDMWVTIKRLLRNKIYVYTQIATIFYVFGYIPFWIFLPKYIEIQYRKSASVASLVTGTGGLVFAAVGILLAGIILQKFKPKARVMAFWNMMIDFMVMIGILSYFVLGCSEVDEQIFLDGSSNSNSTCTEECHCNFVKFSPVCSITEGHTFISACHAGCTNQTTLINGTIIYSNCSCIPYTGPSMLFNETETSHGGFAMSGPCPVDCQFQFVFFMTIICTLKLISSLTRVTNFLVSVRCVEENDKTVSMGITMAVVSIGALIPAPIFYGYIIDSSCLVWGETCTGTGNCWLFNAYLMRQRIIFTSAPFMFVCVLFDLAVWWYISDMNMFHDAVQLNNQNDGSKLNHSEVYEKHELKPLNTPNGDT